MTYWLDLFTGRTWEEFRKAGATVSGFRERMERYKRKPVPGDIFLCYLTGVMRFVGALEITGRSDDETAIWDTDPFPYRFAVKPLVLLEPVHGVPLEGFEGKLDFYKSEKDYGGFRGFLRMSPNPFKRKEDGDLILASLRAAKADPVERKIDPRKLARKPRYMTVEVPKGKSKAPVKTVISIPETEPEADEPITPVEAPEPRTRHTEIQYRLLELGIALGLEVWVARNDRSKTYNGTLLGAMPKMLDELPTQFNEATTRTIELIDVLWLRGNSNSCVRGRSNDVRVFRLASDERPHVPPAESRHPTISCRRTIDGRRSLRRSDVRRSPIGRNRFRRYADSSRSIS
jgi:hypothetical protein